MLFFLLDNFLWSLSKLILFFVCLIRLECSPHHFCTLCLSMRMNVSLYPLCIEMGGGGGGGSTKIKEQGT